MGVSDLYELTREWDYQDMYELTREWEYQDLYELTREDRMSTGTGNTIVLFFSAEMLFSVCRYLS